MFPWTQHALSVNGRTMAYVDEGPRDAVAMLLLSGNPTWGFLYRDFIDPLAGAGYRVIVPDWIGTGYSDHPEVDAALTLAHHIADLVALVDQLALRRFVIVGQDWGGPQGIGAALQRLDNLAAAVLMNTWLFTDYLSPFHTSPRPWTTWHAPLVGALLMHRHKVLSQHGPSAVSTRGMSPEEARGYHHVFDAPGSDHVVLTWPRSIPMRPEDRGWSDMQAIQRRLPELAPIPVLLIWGLDDNVFPMQTCERLHQLLPHAEGPVRLEGAGHFLQDDRGPTVAARIQEFLQRRLGAPK
jgi:haloalkane dehalogenase